MKIITTRWTKKQLTNKTRRNYESISRNGQIFDHENCQHQLKNGEYPHKNTRQATARLPVLPLEEERIDAFTKIVKEGYLLKINCFYALFKITSRGFES